MQSFFVSFLAAAFVFTTFYSLGTDAQLEEDGCAEYRTMVWAKKCSTLSFIYRLYCKADYNRDCVLDGNQPAPDNNNNNSPNTIVDPPEPAPPSGGLGGDSSSFIDPDESDFVETGEPNMIYKECCQANGVPPECMGLCSYTNKDWRILCYREAMCESYLKVMAYCGPNGEDNSECCKDKMFTGVGCYRFCDGSRKFPKLYEFFRMVAGKHLNGNCLKEMNTFNECNLANHSGQRKWDTQFWADEKFDESMELHLYKTCPEADVMRDLADTDPAFRLLAELR